jgi:hypothetical protein
MALVKTEEVRTALYSFKGSPAKRNQWSNVTNVYGCVY